MEEQEILTGLRSNIPSERGEAATKAYNYVHSDNSLSDEVQTQLSRIVKDNTEWSTPRGEIHTIGYIAAWALTIHSNKFDVHTDALITLSEAILDPTIDGYARQTATSCLLRNTNKQDYPKTVQLNLGKALENTMELERQNPLVGEDSGRATTPEEEIQRLSVDALSNLAGKGRLEEGVLEPLADTLGSRNFHATNGAAGALKKANKHQPLPEKLFNHYGSFLINDDGNKRLFGLVNLHPYSSTQVFPEPLLTHLSFALNDEREDMKETAGIVLENQGKRQPDVVRPILSDVMEDWKERGNQEAAARAEAVLQKIPQTLERLPESSVEAKPPKQRRTQGR